MGTFLVCVIIVIVVVQLHLNGIDYTFQLPITFGHMGLGLLFFICTYVPN